MNSGAAATAWRMAASTRMGIPAAGSVGAPWAGLRRLSLCRGIPPAARAVAAPPTRAAPAVRPLPLSARLLHPPPAPRPVGHHQPLDADSHKHPHTHPHPHPRLEADDFAKPRGRHVVDSSTPEQPSRSWLEAFTETNFRSYSSSETYTGPEPSAAFYMNPKFHIFATALGLFAIYYFIHLDKVPVSGRVRFIDVSPQQELDLGMAGYVEVMREYRDLVLPPDHPDVQHVLSVAQRLIAVSGLEHLDWEINVIDDISQVNAFVLPGGKVFVFRGIIPVCADDNGLAVVLGHEIAHQVARHTAETHTWTKAFMMLKFLFMFVLDIGISPATHDFLVDMGLMKPFSRQFETEADYIGLQILCRACFDPESAVDFWHRMHQFDTDQIPQFLSTHPSHAPSDITHIGILTLWVNGRIDDADVSDEQFKSMLRDVFELDWQGDLAKLPFESFKFYQLNEPLQRIRTRSMYSRVKALGIRYFGDGLEKAAILNGWNDLLDFDHPKQIALNSARCGSISMLQHLVDERKVATLAEEHAQSAAEFGQLELLKWLAARMPNGSWTTKVMDDAAIFGQLDCVKWLHTNRTEGCTSRAMDDAAMNRHLAVVEWLHSNRGEGCTNWAITNAVENNCADIVEFLYKNYTVGSIHEAAARAGEYDQLAVIQRIYSLAPDVITSQVADTAACYDGTSVLEWLVHEIGIQPTDDAISYAVERGQFHILPWFRKHTPEVFRAHAASKVANEDSDAMIDWFERDDLPGEPNDVMRLAIEERQVMVVKWLLERTGEDWWPRLQLERARELVGAA